MADSKRYLITVTEFDAAKLDKNLLFSEVPDALGMAIDLLAPAGALDVQKVFLLAAEQVERVTLVLEHMALPYPELVAASEKSSTGVHATVLYLNDRRSRPEDPAGSTRPL